MAIANQRAAALSLGPVSRVRPSLHTQAAASARGGEPPPQGEASRREDAGGRGTVAGQRKPRARMRRKRGPT
jgi:hypothetical protein